MLADWHAHYPMRVVSDLTPHTTVDRMGRVRGRQTLGDRFRALVLNVAIRLGSNTNWWSDYRITPEKLAEGNVGLAMSVLFRPFAEMDLTKPYAAPPDADYFPKLIEDLEQVEAEVATHDPAKIRLAHDRDELDAALAAGATALVHAVEGGFHLGDCHREIEENCATLAHRGVAYVTVAHLFFRQVATNSNALPFLSDSLYRKIFPQRVDARLTPRGEAVVRGLFANRILIDLTHMDPPGIGETLALLDRLDPERQMPVVSTHAGYRFGSQDYMPDEEILLKIKERNGLVGLIMAQHQLNDGIRRRPTKTIEESLEVIFRHVDKIAEVTGSYEHIALGTDFDGFIKPTMGGLETAADLRLLERALHERYGASDAELMASGNSIRVLRTLWPK
jgi:microsomal dipeptidase-like Zn-dependent dipeptidase